MNVFVDSLFEGFYRQYPLTLVDIGASGDVSPLWKKAEKFLKVIAFEPDERACNNLIHKQNGKRVYLNSAVHKEKAVIDFYLTRKQETSSILPPNIDFLKRFPESERFDVLRTVKIKADALDNLLNNNNIEEVDFIKIDTEGNELSILHGAKKIISDSVFGLEIEVEFSQIYKDAPLFSDIDGFIRKFGFSLFDIRSYWWKRKAGNVYGESKGQIVVGEALYLRDLESFFGLLDGKQDNYKKSKLLKAVSICLVFGYIDYAFEIMGEALKRNILAKDEMIVFENSMKRIGRPFRVNVNFKGKQKISNFFYFLYKIFKPSYNDWAASGGPLGNLE